MITKIFFFFLDVCPFPKRNMLANAAWAGLWRVGPAMSGWIYAATSAAAALALKALQCNLGLTSMCELG